MNLQKNFMQTYGQHSQKLQLHFFKEYIFGKTQRKIFFGIWGAFWFFFSAVSQVCLKVLKHIGRYSH